MVNRLKSRFLVNIGMVLDAGMLGNRSKRLICPMRLAPFLSGLVLWRMALFDVRGRCVITRPFLDRRSGGRFLMDMSLGRCRSGLFLMRLSVDFLGPMMIVSDLFMRRRRFRNRRLLAARQGFGMFGLDLDDRCLKLVELATQHFLGRARLHALELPLHGPTSSIVNLDPHLGSIVRQAVNGPSNNCYKIRHQYFLMMPGAQPGRDSS
jgi:hypothetical protein